MSRKILTLLAGGLVTVGWLSVSGSASAAETGTKPSLPVHQAVTVGDDSASIQLVDHRRHRHRHHWRRHYGYPHYGYYYGYPRSYYSYPRYYSYPYYGYRSYYYDPYPYGGVYLYYGW